MKDWKTTLTPIATLLVAGLAKYGFDVPIELVLAILGLGFMVMGYFAKDKNSGGTSALLKCLMAVALCTMLFAPCPARAASVTLAWDASAGATGYKIYYGIASRTYTTTIDVGNVQIYTVPNLAGPSAPSNVRLAMATATKPAAVLLAWDSVANATGYTIKYGTVSGTYTTTITAGNVTQYVLPGLKNATTYYVAVSALTSPGTTYYFAATAYDGGKMESDYSVEVSYNAAESANSAELTFKTLTVNGLVVR
jgi:hypothetical protein